MIADLHIHSHFSMATSKELTPEMLGWWAKRKGIDLLGTGDISHPLWLKELKNKLISAENGFYKLKREFQITDGLPPDNSEPNFILTGEISSIYKDIGKTRKIHQVFVIPDIETAEKFQSNLEKRGVNIRSDGRPICGLSAHDLLELALETDERIFCIPAHIWTPWFSLLGAKSGYDHVTDCYKDLSDHITTLETGLSADVPMIRLVSELDEYTLISSSDAHSPSKLGRNATLIDADLRWDSVINALKDGKTSTLDTNPKLGKYHYDGHRKCNICWHPSETIKHEGICPICNKPVTIGVMNRVYQLADRDDLPKDVNVNWQYISTLQDIISQVTGRGETTKTVQREYNRIIEQVNEFELLLNINNLPNRQIAGEEISVIIDMMNDSYLKIKPGYDGEYGKIIE